MGADMKSHDQLNTSFILLTQLLSDTYTHGINKSREIPHSFLHGAVTMPLGVSIRRLPRQSTQHKHNQTKCTFNVISFDISNLT